MNTEEPEVKKLIKDYSLRDMFYQRAKEIIEDDGFPVEKANSIITLLRITDKLIDKHEKAYKEQKLK